MRGTGERLVNSDGASPVRVLLVEDDPDTAGILELVLKTDGHEVRCAANAFEALLEVRKFQPHVAVVDVGLPIVDGWEATRRLKADDATRAIPVIGLTAHAMAGDREKVIEAGCDDYDTKPVELPRLLQKIEALLARAGEGP